MRSIPFQIIFFLTAVAEVSLWVFDFGTLEIYVKPWIALSLIGLYLKSARPLHKIFVAALSFCWLGDLLLVLDRGNQNYFVGGLASFLIAHILLISVYVKIKFEKGSGLSVPQKARASFPIILATTGLITVLFPSLGDLKIPVILYSIILTIMVLQSIFRYGFTSSKSFWQVFSGAFLFMISDSLLAINKFYHPIIFAGVLIMGTYMAALYLITHGVMDHQVTSTR